MNLLSAFFCGWLFALGLGLAGMAQPSRVIGFLDVAGTWDPTLLFVMGGAVGVGLIAFRRVLKRSRPILADRFHISERSRIDARLLAGAVLFGTGWGLSGYCPGPALMSLVTGQTSVVVFVIAMFAGFTLAGLGRRKSA
ncbi:DUF6691 family protein [Methylococcus sp. EFPC2]|uniref:DUF6691 family protein n=1 Tax=Methylococcus sp. EFPC2 TaxID=2812648 RepID=UPI0019680680|nr:DUF6691 family protein [Methylococcus sp. EFPC2]QSA95674.1 YeeE/YedE family protein [Methylococcus sp. EFPC2]